MGVKNFCWAREKSNGGVCVFFNQKDPVCTYFKLYVLPLDPELQESYPREEEGDGGEIQDRPAIRRKGLGGSPGGVKVIIKKPAQSGVPLGESFRKGILPRPAFHGVGSEKPSKGR
jgi:hypothetical protein